MKLKKIVSNYVQYKNTIHSNIEEIIEYKETHNHNYDFAVSWVDCFASNKNIGRGITKQATWLKKEKNVQIGQLKKNFKKIKNIQFNSFLSYMGINEPFCK